MTAYCTKCLDVFTIWAKEKKGVIYYEPQSRIYGNKSHPQGSFVIMPKEGLNHFCGGALKLIPDYFKTEF